MKKDEIPYLRCYKMTYDTGFAPNPYHGVLTLATCKPVIRRCAKVDDWIAGWTANNVHDKDGNVIYFRDNQKLIYLAKIDDILPLGEYWKKYEIKRPHKIAEYSSNMQNSCDDYEEEGDDYDGNIYDFGDNIYEMIGEEYKQHRNRDHRSGDKKRDTSGKNALICKEFYYFGVNNAAEIKKEIFNYVVPRYKKIELDDNCKKFIEHVQSIKDVTISSKHPQ